jgi:hypothetical protein
MSGVYTQRCFKIANVVEIRTEVAGNAVLLYRRNDFRDLGVDERFSPVEKPNPLTWHSLVALAMICESSSGFMIPIGLRTSRKLPTGQLGQRKLHWPMPRISILK